MHLTCTSKQPWQIGLLIHLYTFRELQLLPAELRRPLSHTLDTAIRYTYVICRKIDFQTRIQITRTAVNVEH